jgi:hypothetical protein
MKPVFYRMKGINTVPRRAGAALPAIPLTVPFLGNVRYSWYKAYRISYPDTQQNESWFLYHYGSAVFLVAG